MCPHKILKIPCTAGTAELKKAYRQLVKLYHPDINKTNQAKTKFIEIQDAYDLLNKGWSHTPDGASYNGSTVWTVTNSDGFSVTITYR